MKRCISRPLALIVLAVLAMPPAVALADGLWSENFEAAKAQAKKEGKDLLLDVTGSDWCPGCIALHREVFETEAFKKEEPKYFVLVEIDLPRHKPQAPELVKQNRMIQYRLKIIPLPTVVLMDADGRPYAMTSYVKGGPEVYLPHLAELRKVKEKRDKLLADAAKAQGTDKAKLLDQVLETLKAAGVEPILNGGWAREIVALDAQNEAGLKAKYDLIARTFETETLVEQGKCAEGIKVVDQALADLKPSGEPLQDLLWNKSICQIKLGDKEGCVATLREALKAAPNSPKADSIKGAIEQLSGSGDKPPREEH